MQFPESFLQEIRDRCPVEGVIGDYMELKRSGPNLVGLCPFHREKTPSFSVNLGKQFYKCFGCGEGGNIFTFVMKIENVEFVDAVAILAKKAGLTLPTGDDEAITKRRTTLLAMNKEAARYFHNNLIGESGVVGMQYFQKRKLPMNIITKFGLGYSLDSWDALVKHLLFKGYTVGEIQESGLVVMGKNGGMYDRFRGRVMFPIIDVRGSVIGFGGRVLDDTVPKYLNSPETIVFNKSRTLFGLNLAKNVKSGAIILAEGYMDVIALHGAGFQTAVASLGTSLTTEQARLIMRYSKEVVISYDSDAAGVAASNRAISILKDAGVSVKVLSIEGGKDPDEFIKTYGKDRFALALKGSDNYIEYRLGKLAAQYDMNIISQKVAFLKESTTILADIESEIERELYIEKIGKTYGISSDALRQEAKKKLGARRKKMRTDLKRHDLEMLTPKVVTKEKDYNSKAFMAEQGLLGLVYEDNHLYDRIKEKISENDFLNSLNSRIFKSFKERIQSGKEVDVALLNMDFGSDEISYITSILNKDINYDNREKAAEDLIDVIKAEKRKLMALNGNENDMKEMIEWYEQIQKKKK